MSRGLLYARERVETPEGRELRLEFECSWPTLHALEVPVIENTLRHINDSRATYFTLAGPYPPILSAALMQYTFSRMFSVYCLHAGGLAFSALCEALMREDCNIEEASIVNSPTIEIDCELFGRAMATNGRLRRMSLNDPTPSFSLIAALPACSALEELTVFIPPDRSVPDEILQAVLGLKHLRIVGGFKNDLAAFQRVWPECCEAEDYHETRLVVKERGVRA